MLVDEQVTTDYYRHIESHFNVFNRKYSAVDPPTMKTRSTAPSVKWIGRPGALKMQDWKIHGKWTKGRAGKCRTRK